MKNINRRLAYLDLSIPQVNKYNSANYHYSCNFRKERGAYHHIWHSNDNNSVNHQLNTIIDLIINLSENLYKTDQKLLSKYTFTEASSSSSNTDNILHNQQFIREQVTTLVDRVGKTLYKAHKFPSKKDIRDLLDLPKTIEIQTQETVQRFQEENRKNLAEIKELVEKLLN